ncbi:MAG: hypothetical protein ACPF8V_08435 [Luteibaculum sp.]
MKRYFLFTLFCLPLLALNCKKPNDPSPTPEVRDTISPELQAAIDQLPPITDTGAHSLGFITKEKMPYAFFPTGEHEDTFLEADFDGYFLNIAARKHDDDGVIFFVGFQIVITTGTPQDTTVHPFLALGYYPMQEVLFTYAISYEREGESRCARYLTGAPFEGSDYEFANGGVTLTRLDSSAGIYSGTFHFTIGLDSAYHANRFQSYCPNPINSFYGRFDVDVNK